MAGGSQGDVRRGCAQRLAASLLGGLLLISGAGTARAADESESAIVTAAASAVEECPDRPEEKSIVVGNGSLDPDVALVTDQGSDALEPIANVSEYEPELAEGAAGRTGEGLTPTLADVPEDEQPGIAPAARGTPESPTADDVCIEEIVEEAEPVAPLQAASFNGVTPGATTRPEVLQRWGQPVRADTANGTLTYELESFPTIEISFAGNRVASIRVELFEPAEPAGLIARLGLAEFQPVTTNDTDGNLVCTTFPERGVTLSYGPGMAAASASDGATSEQASTQASGPERGVFQIEVRPIEAGPFIARVESCASDDYSRRMADLETAIKLGAKEARVLWLLSQLKLATSQAVIAEQLASRAVQFEPASDEYRLQWAKCLRQLARYDEAVEQTRAVLEGTTATQIVRAQALEEMGQLAALGSKEVQQRAIPLHNKAIELADALTKNEDAKVRTDAHEVLLSAHLAIAERIAVGDWRNKDEFVAQWLTRASALAEQMIAAGEADVSLRLQVAVSALAAGGRLQPPVDPQLWIAEAEQAAADLEPALHDREARNLLHWQLGLAYFYAAEIQHRRGESELAVKYGELADATLTPLAEERADLPDTNYALGRLYFQIGAVHAVHQRDHEAACQWYDRAAGLLLEPAPVTKLANPGQHGDALVSMGVSYWEVGQRDRAYELTKAGVELVEQGVSEGLLAASALDVPQGNFNAMARALGKVELTTPESNAGRTQMAQRQRSMNKRGGPRPQNRMAERRSTTSDGAQRR